MAWAFVCLCLAAARARGEAVPLEQEWDEQKCHRGELLVDAA